MSEGKVVVLGVNGHIGRAAAAAFVAAGWDVTGMARNDKHIEGVHFVRGDSDSVEDMRRAIGDARVVVNALNMPYHLWFNGRMEAQMARVLEAIGTDGKTMLFPGNIYNYSPANEVLTPETPQQPPTPRGELRVRVEQMFRAAADRGDLQVIVLRAGDFFGPGTTGDWFDQIMMTDVKKRKVKLMGTPGIGHSWAYLPDLGRAFEALASLRTTFGTFENFHFAGYHLTPEQMGAAIEKASPVPVRTSRFPLWMLQAYGMVDPIVREVAKMAYSWRNPLQLSDDRLTKLLGDNFSTPLDIAIKATIAPFFVATGEPAPKIVKARAA